MKLLLFDLDGTLVSTGEAGIRALDHAFKVLYNISHATHEVELAGKTDNLIFQDIFEQYLDQKPTMQEIKAIGQSYLTQLAIEVPQSQNYRILAGIKSFLEKTDQNEELQLGLGTGNLEQGARIKLERAELNPFFPFGGFGSDARERDEMLKIGLSRAEAHLGRKIQARDTYIIGDTVRDVAAAQKAGYVSVAVASGHASIETLETSRPDILIESFETPEALWDVLI